MTKGKDGEEEDDEYFSELHSGTRYILNGSVPSEGNSVCSSTQDAAR